MEDSKSSVSLQHFKRSPKVLSEKGTLVVISKYISQTT